MTADQNDSTEGPVYYQPSNHVPPGARLKMLLAGAAAAYVLGAVHAFLAGLLKALAGPNMNSFAAISIGLLMLLLYFIVTVFYGVSVGGIAMLVGRKLGVRGGQPIFWTAFAISLCAYYSAWNFQMAEARRLGWLVAPWTIAAHAYGDVVGRGILVGLIAGAILFLEALLIIASVIFTVCSSFNEPYCDHCGRWTESHDDVAVLHAAYAEPLRELLERGTFEVLWNLGSPEPEHTMVTTVKLRTCPACDKSDYMTVCVDRRSRIFSPRDKDSYENFNTLKGLASASGWRDVVAAKIGDTFRSETVVEHLHIPHDVATALLAAKTDAQKPESADTGL